ncbi:hypothetical protein BHE97_05770 [Aeromicrobium sp. PE09-221]|uniref:hypothetical protein n=1 Tax=Aeromicrobium sp. PE09-221 TaxID=1898043 RepID=UPI000B3ECD0F|nr:hypothetical protein [Aeromicrobium sp. PE09-221]OUZ11343.1 hypothetical protein BHE97_05770 [Aeromicrobium sp. PE09-221]
MKPFTRAAAAVSTAVLVGSLAACGGGADRPSQQELADAITSEESPLGGAAVPDEMADCVAGVFVDSDLSDEALRAMADLDEDYEASEEDEETLGNLSQDVMTECTPEIETPGTPDSE